MRARNIKPGFFKNEKLGELPPEARLLFAGLWCLADREGRLEDRPKRIKADLFPYDSFEIEPLLERLVGAGFIQRYQAADEFKAIQILTFRKHQTPHSKEGASTIPAFRRTDISTGQAQVEHQASVDIHETKSPVLAPDKHGASTRQAPTHETKSPVLAPDKHCASTSQAPPDSLIPDSLIPDSLIPDSLIPDSLIPDSTPPAGGVGRETRPKARPLRRCPPEFEVTPELMQSMAGENLTGIDLDAETRKFRDHTFATARIDWPATWRNWIRGAIERSNGPRTGKRFDPISRPPSTPLKSDHGRYSAEEPA
jgi:hypothetical protein